MHHTRTENPTKNQEYIDFFTSHMEQWVDIYFITGNKEHVLGTPCRISNNSVTIKKSETSKAPLNWIYVHVPFENILCITCRHETLDEHDTLNK